MEKVDQCIKLPSGYLMPKLGLGTWQWENNMDKLDKAIDSALACGFRAIDTAYSYNNEVTVGEALKRWFDSGRIKREQVFVITKLTSIFKQSASEIKRACLLSLKNLQLDYIDLYLIHSPYAFKAMEALVDEGLVRSIGVSNFNSEQIQRISTTARHPVSNNQVECHAYLQQKGLRKACQKHGVVVTAYQPLGDPSRPKTNPFGDESVIKPLVTEDPVVTELAAKYNKTVAQILITFLLQSGLATVPKSFNPQHIQENIQCLDFELTSEDMRKLEQLDRGVRYSTIDYAKGHPEYPFKISE